MVKPNACLLGWVGVLLLLRKTSALRKKWSEKLQWPFAVKQEKWQNEG